VVSEGRDGVCATGRADLLVVEMSTVGPDAIRRLESALPEGVPLIDAPVMGSLAEAEAGRLMILAGGRHEHVERARHVLDDLGTVVRIGQVGSGAAAKLVVNATLFGVLTTFGEAIALADRLGLARDDTYRALSTGPLAAQVARRRAAIERGDYPPRFALRLACKDADLINEHVRAAGLELPVQEAARAWLAAAQSEGRGGDDYTAVLATVVGRRTGS
jgi:3-hydroxyisobutyrate dehydrogenase/2-hydroxy-3-oxopropionate reductase